VFITSYGVTGRNNELFKSKLYSVTQEKAQIPLFFTNERKYKITDHLQRSEGKDPYYFWT